MTGLCDILEPAGPEPYDPDPGWSPWRTTRTGVRCRVQLQSDRGQAPVVGDQVVTAATYLVTLPLEDAEGLRVGEGGHVLRLTGYKPGHAGDPALIGRELRAVQVMLGTLQFERDVVCTELSTQNQGGTSG
jgi:hypothetical protein